MKKNIIPIIFLALNTTLIFSASRKREETLRVDTKQDSLDRIRLSSFSREPSFELYAEDNLDIDQLIICSLALQKAREYGTRGQSIFLKSLVKQVGRKLLSLEHPTPILRKQERVEIPAIKKYQNFRHLLATARECSLSCQMSQALDQLIAATTKKIWDLGGQSPASDTMWKWERVKALGED